MDHRLVIIKESCYATGLSLVPQVSILNSSSTFFLSLTCILVIVAATSMAGNGGATKDASREGPIPFRAGIQAEMTGLNPTKKIRYTQPQKKKNSALVNHKKWLLELSRRKEQVMQNHA